MQLEVTWTQLKAFLDARAITCQFVEFDTMYMLAGLDGPFSLAAKILKVSPASADQTDFETNYKAAGNTVIQPLDAGGAPIARAKMTKSGWHYQEQSIEITTACLTSTHNSDKDGVDLGFTTTTLYDVSDVVTVVEVDAVKTVITWEPDYDIDIIGARIYQSVAPTADVRFYVTGVPDYAQPDGSVAFMQGGANLRHMGTGKLIDLDGRVPKSLLYNNPVSGTNKFELLLTHPAGTQCTLQLMMEIYKP